ncbi:MAG: diaminopimelate epimerase [Clostridiales Family XIII bacterium]|nr:diaminopimelate epimerase [Clostridiales Family XIII bacterium]
MYFTKMHGAGNDYIYIDCFRYPEPPDLPRLAKEMSRRHFSVGADGLVLMYPPKPGTPTDARMRMFNADGSEGKMCGNAIRCVAKYLVDNGLTDKTELAIDTLSGVKRVTLTASSISVDMGRASFAPEDIPINSKEPAIDYPLTVLEIEFRITAVSMGNPHAVNFFPIIDPLPLEHIGPLFENHEFFPERVNTEFVQVVSETELKVRVWERGSGETMACGTGACASVAAAVKKGICKADTPVTVKLPGGDLVIRVSADFDVTMTGGAEKAFEGVYEYDAE